MVVNHKPSGSGLSWGGRLALGLLVVMALLCLGAPLVTGLLGVDGEAVDLFAASLPPSAEHPLGTDDLGRDLLARLLYGGRVSLVVGLAGALAAAVLGTAIGLWAGTRGGAVDAWTMRVTDGVIALPLLPVLIIMAAVDPTKLGLSEAVAHSPAVGVLRVVLLVALLGWTATARLVRAQAQSVVRRDFVRAAQALGVGEGRLMVRHILPQVMPVVTVAATLSVAQVILLESALSFLGLGIQPPIPSWGNMLTGALQTLWTAPWQAAWPGALIFVTVIAVNIFGDALNGQGNRLDRVRHGGQPGQSAPMGRSADKTGR